MKLDSCSCSWLLLSVWVHCVLFLLIFFVFISCCCNYRWILICADVVTRICLTEVRQSDIVRVEGGSDTTTRVWRRERRRKKGIVDDLAVDEKGKAYPLAWDVVKEVPARMNWD